MSPSSDCCCQVGVGGGPQVQDRQLHAAGQEVGPSQAQSGHGMEQNQKGKTGKKCYRYITIDCDLG